MNDQQENRLSHFEKVNAWLTKNTTDLAATPALGATLQPQLNDIIKKIRDDDEHAVQDNTGYAGSKEDTEIKFENMVHHIGSGLESYADDTGDFVLMNAVEFTISQIRGFRDNRLLQYGQFVYSKATDKTIQPALISDHNITKEDIDTLGKLITQYEAALPLPQQMKGESVAWGKQVDRDLVQADKIMASIRRKMNTYRSSNLLLFETFTAVDKVDDTGSHKGGEKSVNAGGTESVASFTYMAATKFTFLNTGNYKLHLTMYNQGTPVGTGVDIDGGQTLNATLGDMGAGGDELRVSNSSGTIGTYKFEM